MQPGFEKKRVLHRPIEVDVMSACLQSEEPAVQSAEHGQRRAALGHMQPFDDI
jgi:hypothetical protein